MGLRFTSVHKDERGIAHLFLILIVVGVVGVAGFAFWRVSSYNNNKGENANGVEHNDGSGNNSATLSEECVAATGDENICRLGAISSLSKYAAEVRMTMDGGNGSVTYTVSYDGKGNTQISSDIVNGVTVDGKQYVQINGKWWDTSGDSTQAVSDPVNFSVATTAGITYTNQGKVPCGNDTCFKYHLSGGILGEGTVDVTFGDKDYLPRHYDANNIMFGQGGRIVMDITYKDVTISAPSGARPISEFSASDL